MKDYARLAAIFSACALLFSACATYEGWRNLDENARLQKSLYDLRIHELVVEWGQCDRQCAADHQKDDQPEEEQQCKHRCATAKDNESDFIR